MFLEGVGLVLTPGPERPLVVGTPLFLVRPRGMHLTARVKSFAGQGTTRAIAVDLNEGEVPPSTRVFGRVTNVSSAN